MLRLLGERLDLRRFPRYSSLKSCAYVFEGNHMLLGEVVETWCSKKNVAVRDFWNLTFSSARHHLRADSPLSPMFRRRSTATRSYFPTLVPSSFPWVLCGQQGWRRVRELVVSHGPSPLRVERSLPKPPGLDADPVRIRACHSHVLPRVVNHCRQTPVFGVVRVEYFIARFFASQVPPSHTSHALHKCPTDTCASLPPRRCPTET